MCSYDSVGDMGGADLSASEPALVQVVNSFLRRINAVELNINFALEEKLIRCILHINSIVPQSLSLP